MSQRDHTQASEGSPADTIKATVARYRAGAIAHSDSSDPEKANRGAGEVHTCYKLLRSSPAGREALGRLMDDPEPSVRCWAAAECLQLDPARAVHVLMSLRDSKGPYSTTAETTLEEYGKGRLDFEY